MLGINGCLLINLLKFFNEVLLNLNLIKCGFLCIILEEFLKLRFFIFLDFNLNILILE